MFRSVGLKFKPYLQYNRKLDVKGLWDHATASSNHVNRRQWNTCERSMRPCRRIVKSRQPAPMKYKWNAFPTYVVHLDAGLVMQTSLRNFSRCLNLGSLGDRLRRSSANNSMIVSFRPRTDIFLAKPHQCHGFEIYCSGSSRRQGTPNGCLWIRGLMN